MHLSEAQNNFNKLVSECMCVSLTQRAAIGMRRYRVEKGYKYDGTYCFF